MDHSNELHGDACATNVTDLCELCGSDDVDHGSEHMGAVEFPECICESCWRGGYGPQLPTAFCRSCSTRLSFEPTWVTFNTRGWRCHCEGCVDGEYVGDPLRLQMSAIAGEGNSPWEALDDCAAMHFDCEPEELLEPKEETHA